MMMTRLRLRTLLRALWFLLFLFAVFNQSNLAGAAKVESFVDPMKHDVFLVTPKTFDNLIGHARNKDAVAALLHFKSSQPKDKKFINEVYNVAAKEVKGMARLGAIDCVEWKAFCQEHLNPNVESPLVVVYPPNPWPAFVQKAQDKASIVKATLQQIPDKHVKILNDQNVDTFLSSDLAIPKVLLFSSKEKPPVLFKALSNAFKDRLAFALIPGSASGLVARYQVKSLPAVHLLKAATKGTGLGKPLVYPGKDLSFEALHSWLNVHAETFVKGGGFIEQSGSETAAAPKPWLVQRVPEVTGPSHQDVCFKGAVLCAIFLTRGKITDEQTAMLEELGQKFSAGDKLDRGARFKFMWLDADIEENFLQALNIAVESTTFPSLVVVNPHKRLRFQALPPDQEATRVSIQNLLERIAAGDGRFSPIKKNKLPPFAVRDADGQPLKKTKEEL